MTTVYNCLLQVPLSFYFSHNPNLPNRNNIHLHIGALWFPWFVVSSCFFNTCVFTSLFLKNSFSFLHPLVVYTADRRCLSFQTSVWEREIWRIVAAVKPTEKTPSVFTIELYRAHTVAPMSHHLLLVAYSSSSLLCFSDYAQSTLTDARCASLIFSTGSHRSLVRKEAPVKKERKNRNL